MQLSIWWCETDIVIQVSIQYYWSIVFLWGYDHLWWNTITYQVQPHIWCKDLIFLILYLKIKKKQVLYISEIFCNDSSILPDQWIYSVIIQLYNYVWKFRHLGTAATCNSGLNVNRKHFDLTFNHQTFDTFPFYIAIDNIHAYWMQ